MEFLKPPAPDVQVLTLSIREYRALVKATGSRTLNEAEQGHLDALVDTAVAQQLAMKADHQGESEELQKYQKMLFGPRSEKTRVVLGKKPDPKANDTASEEPADAQSTQACDARKDAPKKARKKAETGHGRLAATAYTGARREKVPLTTVKTGDPCPKEDCDGRMYRYFEIKAVVRIEGVAPLSACIYELEQYRCHDCGFLMCAKLPAAAGPEKYKATAVANLALMKYCVCMPGSRLEMLQDGYGVPVRSSTQWDILKRNTPVARAVHEELLTLAANMPFLFNDDTGARVLEMTRKEREEILGATADPKRKGMFTTGIVAKYDDYEIALYFTGPLYAAENLARLLERREPGLPLPFLMCDGLISRNLPKSMKDKIKLGQCVTHARRQFIGLESGCPDEVRFVLETIAAIYTVDDAAKEHNLSDEGRLMLHDNESRPYMDALKAWMDKQIEQKLVEPNSGLGRAIAYTQKRWTELCCFMEVPGASLDNNITEQILRRVAHYRNGSLYYRTHEGAKVADCWMSVIRTAEKAGVNVFDYLVALLEHPDEVNANPKAWLPWTYIETLAALEDAEQKAARAAA